MCQGYNKRCEGDGGNVAKNVGRGLCGVGASVGMRVEGWIVGKLVGAVVGRKRDGDDCRESAGGELG